MINSEPLIQRYEEPNIKTYINACVVECQRVCSDVDRTMLLAQRSYQWIVTP